nr:hypothetical protein [Tanacetum cinerariifolium]
LSIHEEEAKDEESFDPIVQTPENSDDEGNDDARLGLNVGGEEGQDAEDDDEELYRAVNINLEGRDVQMTDVHTKQEFEETHLTITPVAVQLQFNRLQDEAQDENEDFINKLDENIQKIINEQVKEQVKKMESNKSIHRSYGQRNLYKALVDAYECDKIILDTYGDTVTLKRRRDDADKDEEPSAGSDRGSKRRREGKEPESTSGPKGKATKTTGKSTEGSKSHQKTTSESALAEELM